MKNAYAALAAADLLGGVRVFRRAPDTLADWIPLVRKGLPPACAVEIAERLGFSRTELANILGISTATLRKRQRSAHLTVTESSRLLRQANIVQRADEVFESLDNALAWLKSPNLALGSVTPMSLLDTELGAEEVRRRLGRIEQGIPI
ncbi:MAG TPA: antitoxin Xre/MbcA/ParS toxin-binding domain-containing protein [Burkholderiaceae bacterium]|nr:antitoxin Xre/MbcA/ParS toxin-binding domain-containing protein [Burkholderiaceae bacterium]